MSYLMAVFWVSAGVVTFVSSSSHVTNLREPINLPVNDGLPTALVGFK